jgi:hypothetical protein
MLTSAPRHCRSQGWGAPDGATWSAATGRRPRRGAPRAYAPRPAPGHAAAHRLPQNEGCTRAGFLRGQETWRAAIGCQLPTCVHGRARGHADRPTGTRGAPGVATQCWLAGSAS